MLSGLRVLDLTDEPGFLAGKILGDLGADVIKVEPPGGDPARRHGPFLGGIEDPERSLPWLAMNTSKRGITLDLEAESGRGLLRGLAVRADVVLETARPGAMDQLGIGYQALSGQNPRLIYCALTPFGQTGPYAHLRGRDLIVVAMGGNASMTGDADRPPVRCTMPTAYYHAAPEAALGILMAVYARETSGRGQFVDISMHECQLQSLLSWPGQFAHFGKLPGRSGARTGRTREIWSALDGYITYGLRGGPARLPSLIATVKWMEESGKAPEWLSKYDWAHFNHNLLTDDETRRFEEAFAAFFRSKTKRELYEESLKRRILLAPCNDAKDILEQPQLRDRGLFVTLDYPHLGASIEHPAFFARSTAHSLGLTRRAPRVGEHNDEVLGE